MSAMRHLMSVLQEDLRERYCGNCCHPLRAAHVVTASTRHDDIRVGWLCTGCGMGGSWVVKVDNDLRAACGADTVPEAFRGLIR